MDELAGIPGPVYSNAVQIVPHCPSRSPGYGKGPAHTGPFCVLLQIFCEAAGTFTEFWRKTYPLAKYPRSQSPAETSAPVAPMCRA